MPSQSHPQAQFVPIQPDLDLAALVENTSNFDYVTRLPTEMLKEHSIQSLEQLVLLHVVIGGKPLVIEGWGDILDPSLFSPGWLQEHLGKRPERVRDIPKGTDIPMTIGHYLKSMNQLTNQFSSSNFRDPKRQRLYLKDIDIPEEWARDLKEFIPETFFYLNDCIESRTGGDGAILEPNEYGQMRYGKGVAPAGDLMSSLPTDMQALNMMCYIGHEGTYTPAHREMCASLGHNIMVEASSSSNGEKAGSSIWFMTETKEREVVSEYFLSMLGHDIEVEKHFAQINAWKKAPFNVWVVEQKVGDLILIPPLAPHQVWNRGTRTMKAAWNRTTVDTLELAIREALPRARMVCRDEQYKNKAIIYYSLVKYHGLIQRGTIETKMWKYGRVKQLFEDFKRLFALYTEVLVSEMFCPSLPIESSVEFLPFDSNVTCSYCRCNIWNRFLTCKTCIEIAETGEEDTYDICMDCYAMGRSCSCISNLKWVEQWDWSTLALNYEQWRDAVVQYDGYFNIQTSPQPLEVARKRYGKKPVAQVCQEQLTIRPWHDIKNPVIRDPSPGVSDVEPEPDDEGYPKRKKGKRRRVGPEKNKTHACHVCFHHHQNWKMAFCTTCNNAYCYGVLWRAFDLMPQQAMEDRDWSCPKCLQICSCGKCRKNPNQIPYAPKGTLLGHDTRQVADFRSVESLVDFSKTNLGWLRGENDDNPQQSSRMKKLREKAEAEKAREDTIDEKYLIDDGDQQSPFVDYQIEGDNPFGSMVDIDPQLRGPTFSGIPHPNSNVPYRSPYGPTGSATNSVGYASLDTRGSDQYGWLDGNHDFEIGTYNRPETVYTSKILAPEGPMLGFEQFYPDPSLNGKTRMMGIGYYQQGNGIDRILYDPPNLKSGNDAAAPVAASSISNFTLSKLVKAPQQTEESLKKRRHGSGVADEADGEFFTSKRQKKLDETMRLSGLNRQKSQTEDEITSKPQRATSRRAAKLQTYTDLGEDAVPISEEATFPGSCKTNDEEDENLELAKRVMKTFTNNAYFEKSPKQATPSQRRRVFGKLSSVTPSDVTPSSDAVTPAKARRQSAWLARKEAEDAHSKFPMELSERSGRRRATIQQSRASPTIDASSKSDGDSKNGGGRIGDDASNQFGEFDVLEESAEGGIQGTAELRHDLEEEKVEAPTPKRRGRPPKQAPAEARLSSSTSTKKLLSLNEKLALKGKSFKIVAAKSRKSIKSSSAPLIPRSTLAIVLPKSLEKRTLLGSPVGSSGMNGVKTQSRLANFSAKISPLPKLFNGNTSVPPKPVLPAKKGPTVVRLGSPSAD